MGDPNASIPTTEPVYMRPMFGALGSAPYSNSKIFVSQRSIDCNTYASYKHVHKEAIPVKNCRGVTKLDMKLNAECPAITVDPESYRVTANGLLLQCEPVGTLPLTELYFTM